MGKPILCLDFDGVVHSYTSGWKGADAIPDPPVPGALEFIVKATRDFRVCIFSSRSGQPGGVAAMSDWLYRWSHGENDHLDPEGVLAHVEFPTDKPAALVSIDDRALTFDGRWPEIATLLAFKPWNKR